MHRQATRRNKLYVSATFCAIFDDNLVHVVHPTQSRFRLSDSAFPQDEITKKLSRTKVTVFLSPRSNEEFTSGNVEVANSRRIDRRIFARDDYDIPSIFRIRDHLAISRNNVKTV